jgi:hypothetical protein
LQSTTWTPQQIPPLATSGAASSSSSPQYDDTQYWAQLAGFSGSDTGRPVPRRSSNGSADTLPLAGLLLSAERHAPLPVYDGGEVGLSQSVEPSASEQHPTLPSAGGSESGF